MDRSKQFYEFLSNVYDNILCSAVEAGSQGHVQDIEVNQSFLNHEEVRVSYDIIYSGIGGCFRRVTREAVYSLSDEFEDSLMIIPGMVEDIKGSFFRKR